MKVRELLKLKNNWIKGQPAVDKNRMWTPLESPEAVSFCLIGAIYKCYKDEKQRAKIYKRIRKELKLKEKEDWIIWAITVWNDDKKRTFTEVKNLVKKLDI